MDDLESRSEAMAILLGRAETSAEINTLTRVGLRAGFLWRCTKCREDYYPNRDACRCGAQRPELAP